MQANALMNEVPLVSASPSLASSAQRLQPELGEHVGGVAHLAVEE